MKYLKYIPLLLLAGCTTPFIVPDNTSDNVVLMAIKDEIAQEGASKPSYGWTLWYAPVVLISLLWAWREFIRKPMICEDGLIKDEKDRDGDGIDDSTQNKPNKPEQLNT
jgi:hypothetical protein